MNASAPMKNRSPWTKLMAATLPVWLGLVPLQAEAVPDEVGGNATNLNVIEPLDGLWTTLRSTLVLNPTNQRRWCIATGSADAQNNGLPFQSTLYTLTLNVLQPPIDGACERTLQFHGITDVRIKEITTTCGPFLTNPGANFIYWLARTTGAGNAIILDRSMTVVCTDTRTETIP